MINRRLAKRAKEKNVIGFLGLDSGVGTTHLAIATANYIVTRWGLSAAVVELGNHPCIQDMDPDLCVEEHHCFHLDGVSYYPHTELQQIPEVMNDPYQFLILDLGCDVGSVWQEFLRCDKKFMVGSLSPWRISRVENNISRLYSFILNKKLSCCFITLSDSSYEKKRIQNTYHVPVRTMPFIADPFWLVKDQLSFFQQLL